MNRKCGPCVRSYDSPYSMAYPVSKSEFGRLVERALSELPEQFGEFLQEVPVEIRDRPSKTMLQDVELGKDDLLLGLYVGRPMTELRNR